MNPYADDANELIVTLTFAYPVEEDDAQRLRERATRLRDQWTDEPADLVDFLQAIGDDYDLQVKPFSEP